MFENEGTEIESQTDVTPETPSESPESQPEQQEGQEVQAATPKQPEVPFHEHPRWKEVMEERNAERQARAQLEQQLQQMQKQILEAQKPKSTQPDFKEVSSKMLERLKGIDPEYAQYTEMLQQQALSAKEELQAFREEQFVNSAVSKVQELNSKNGVTQEVAALYEAQLDRAYREGKIRSLADLEKTYASIHEPFSKMLAEREKQALAKYTTEKKAAAAKPAAQPKGKAPAPGQPRGPTNSQDRRSAMIAEALTQIRASKDLG
jgi:hypothetical protein